MTLDVARRFWQDDGESRHDDYNGEEDEGWSDAPWHGAECYGEDEC